MDYEIIKMGVKKNGNKYREKNEEVFYFIYVIDIFILYIKNKL